jgi:hypothetical protein
MQQLSDNCNTDGGGGGGDGGEGEMIVSSSFLQSHPPSQLCWVILLICTLHTTAAVYE